MVTLRLPPVDRVQTTARIPPALQTRPVPVDHPVSTIAIAMPFGPVHQPPIRTLQPVRQMPTRPTRPTSAPESLGVVTETILLPTTSPSMEPSVTMEPNHVRWSHAWIPVRAWIVALDVLGIAVQAVFRTPTPASRTSSHVLARIHFPPAPYRAWPQVQRQAPLLRSASHRQRSHLRAPSSLPPLPLPRRAPRPRPHPSTSPSFAT